LLVIKGAAVGSPTGWRSGLSGNRFSVRAHIENMQLQLARRKGRAPAKCKKVDFLKHGWWAGRQNLSPSRPRK
jgi:hypothetical protein